MRGICSFFNEAKTGHSRIKLDRYKHIFSNISSKSDYCNELVQSSLCLNSVSTSALVRACLHFFFSFDLGCFSEKSEIFLTYV